MGNYNHAKKDAQTSEPSCACEIFDVVEDFRQPKDSDQITGLQKLRSLCDLYGSGVNIGE